MTRKILDHDPVEIYGDRFDKWKNKTEKDKLIETETGARLRPLPVTSER